MNKAMALPVDLGLRIDGHPGINSIMPALAPEPPAAQQVGRARRNADGRHGQKAVPMRAAQISLEQRDPRLQVGRRRKHAAVQPTKPLPSGTRR